jgi:hypothetical protein
MLRGLPRSKELGWWSTHSGRSSSYSSTSDTSYAWASGGSDLVCSSWTVTSNSSCDLVWCKCISKHVNRASDVVVWWSWWHDMQINTLKLIVKTRDKTFLQGSPHHPRSIITNACHLLYSPLLTILVYFYTSQHITLTRVLLRFINTITLTFQVTPARWLDVSKIHQTLIMKLNLHKEDYFISI